MNRAPTVFLLLLALAAFVLVAVWKPLRAEPKAIGSALFELQPDQVRSVTITDGDESLDIRRTEQGWQINPEPLDRASGEIVRAIIRLATTTPILDRISARELGPDDLAQYGLKKSRRQLDFRGDGKQSLLFGKDAADDSRIYVRFEDSNDVYLITDELPRLIFRPAADFRDLKLSLLTPDRIDRFIIRQPAGEMEIRRGVQGWEIVRPMVAPADEAAVEAFLENLLRLKATGIEEKDQPAQQGLSDSQTQISLFAEGGGEPEVFTLGSPLPDGGAYLGCQPRNVVLRLPEAGKTLFDASLSTFRDTALARVNPDLVDKIRLKSPGGEVTLVRKESGWQIEDASGRRSADPALVPSLFTLLANTKSRHYEPATVGALASRGLDVAPYRITFLSVVSENTPESPAGEQVVTDIALGTASSEGLVPAHVEGASEMAWVPPGILSGLPFPRPPASTPPTE